MTSRYIITSPTVTTEVIVGDKIAEDGGACWVFYFQKCDHLGLEQSPLLFFGSTSYSLYTACPWLNHYPVKVFVSESVIKRASCTTKTLHLHCFQFSDPKQSQMRVHVTMA